MLFGLSFQASICHSERSEKSLPSGIVILSKAKDPDIAHRTTATHWLFNHQRPFVIPNAARNPYPLHNCSGKVFSNK